jgi:two-component system, OmpR family, response regulator CpxR
MPTAGGRCNVSGSNIEQLSSVGRTPAPKKGGWHRPHQTILVVDHDVNLSDLLAESLRRQGFLLATVHDGATELEGALSNEFALVVLDLMLPGLDGSGVPTRSNVPVIILTARGEGSDRILGLESDSHDDLANPFNPRELATRMQTVLGYVPSNESHRKSDRLQVGDIDLNASARTVRRGNRPVELTSVEFDLLVMFLKSPGQVMGREELTKSVLGRELRANDRSIDVHVSNLRRKLGANLDGSERIKNIRSTGYLYVPLT